MNNREEKTFKTFEEQIEGLKRKNHKSKRFCRVSRSAVRQHFQSCRKNKGAGTPNHERNAGAKYRKRAYHAGYADNRRDGAQCADQFARHAHRK